MGNMETESVLHNGSMALEMGAAGNESNNGSSSINHLNPISPMEEFSESGTTTIIAYSVLFAVAFIGNVAILVLMLTGRRTQTRINYLIMHLAFADTLVTLFNMPLEIAWRSTVAWRGGSIVCKFFQYCRVFSLFLSSFIIIVVSLDRYFAIIRPIQRFASRSWSNKMLIAAWLSAAICAIPQVIFTK
jgi:gonadotropin-releasing hormone receptor